MGKMRAAGEGDRVLGERVRQRRKALGLTAKRLARAAGVSPAYLSQIEHGKHLRPSPEVLDALAAALALTPAALAPEVVPPAEGAAAEAGASSPPVPPALAALAAEGGIDATTVAMLGGIQVEGRQPATREGWLLVLLAIRAACGGGLPVAPVSLIPHPRTNGDELAMGGRDGEMNARDGGGMAVIGRELAVLTVPDQLVRLLVAAFLGAIIGVERERGERAAGLRTHALVSTASALMMLVSAYGFADVVTASRTVVLDPSRIAAQVVSGIGFLGAGAIILRKDTVRGLTTAGSIWLVAGLGLACGAGMYAAAGATTALALLILRGFKLVEQRLFAHKRLVRVTLRMRRQPGQMDAIDARVRAGGLEMRRVQIDAGRAPDEQTVRVDVQGKDMAAFPALAERLRGVPGVRMVAYGARSLTTKESVTADANERADDSA